LRIGFAVNPHGVWTMRESDGSGVNTTWYSAKDQAGGAGLGFFCGDVLNEKAEARRK
jgi:hypothetical protein